MRGFFYGPHMPEITELKLVIDLTKATDTVQVLKAISEASLAAADGLKLANTAAESSALLLRAQAREATAASKALGAMNASEEKALTDAFNVVSGLGNAYSRLAAFRAKGSPATAGAGAKYGAFAFEEQRQDKLDTGGKAAADAKAKAAPAAPTRKYSEAEWKEAGEFAKTFAEKLETAFGKVGGTIGKMTTALLGFRKAQDDIDFTFAKEMGEAKTDKDKDKAQDKKHMSTVKQYREMATAAKGFFKEHSTGYEVMEKVEKGFRAYEFAMNAKSLFEKLTNITTVTAAKTAATTAEVTSTASSVGPVAAAEAAKSSAYGTSALAASLAAPFPANIGAFAMVAGMLLAIGVAVSGGGGGVDTTAKNRQAATGTGTVLGDSSAKSDSIARSIELMASNSDIELSHTSRMLASLRNIESSIAGLGNLLIRNAGLTGATAAGTMGSAAALGSSAAFIAVTGGLIGLTLDKITGGLVGKITGKIFGSIFGGATSVIDTGLTVAKGTVASIADGGAQAMQYTDTKKSGGWFRSDKYATGLTGLGPEANDQFGKIIGSMADGVEEAGKLLGLGGTAFTDHLNSFVVDLGKISLKGLKGAEIQEALETAFSKLGDEMAHFGVGGLEKFQQVGEGYFETLTRVAVNYTNLDAIIASIGATFGATGVASIAAREYLIELTGGIDGLADKTSAFAENYLTEAERLAPVQKYVTEQMAALGYASVTTRDQFKDTVLELANSGALATKTGAEQYAGLMALADAFAKTHAATEDLTKSEQGIADERKGIQDKLDQMMMTSAQLRTRERASVDASNLALYDQLQARQNIASAYETESAALKSTIDRLKTFGDGIRSFKDSLLLGSLSTLTPMQKMAEAQRQYEDTLAKAKTGDAAAQSALTAAATAYLTANQVVKSSSDAYAADAARVQADLAALAAIAGAQLSDAQKQLTALDTQVGQLINLNKTAVGIQEAVAALGAALRAGGKTDITDGMQFASGFGMSLAVAFDEVVVDAPAAQAMQRYFSGGDGANEALVAEIKGLREEVRQLRADQDQQTGAIISSNYDANERAADKVSAGASEAARATVWASQSKASIV